MPPLRRLRGRGTQTQLSSGRLDDTGSPRSHEVEVAGRIVVGEVPAELWDAGLVVVAVLGVELNVAVTVQKDQLHRKKPNRDHRHTR